jgi:ectoine hydroxylase-related dioxygenase (phytanoyl-CoA dioxygenase family)
MPAPTRESLLQLLKDARIQGAELDTFVARATDADYWRALAPDCRIEREDSAIEFGEASRGAVDGAILELQRNGYFRLPGLLGGSAIRRLNAAIDAVRDAGWPASFLFVYDEAWLAARSPAAARVLESALGPGFRQICHVWTHAVKPEPGATGWSPHVDGDGGRRMTLWVALTPATPDNGCMHVVPANAVRQSPDLIRRFGTDFSQFTRPEVTSLLHATHALTASPGDAFGWGFDVIHWGGTVRSAGTERRALSFEFIAADQEPAEGEERQTAMATLPPFNERLRAVASGIVTYTKFEPRVDRFADVAAEMAKRLRPPG